jgi:thioesterase domain-containing protein
MVSGARAPTTYRSIGFSMGNAAMPVTTDTAASGPRAETLVALDPVASGPNS